ncbi:flagellar assembly protein FliW [Selenomonas ruminantium]|jgi:flagellar assembly factor FliW|uniref:flagellar assembly protein FliW n=1 Tax=Selenomonas ruminantium TaxID=971 RepID=UPI0003FB2E3A|nr:flagellar assembly protein FliW [Selenomonas ruminantium]
MRKVNTLRFGEVEVAEDKVVHFADGIPAFEDEHEFVIVPYDEESPYVFLQSLTTPDLAFLMTVPFVFFPDYAFELDDENQGKLNLYKQEDMLIYTLITVNGGQVQDMTANLMAPVVINTANMQARQIVLDRSSYTTKHRLFPKNKEEQ